MLPILCLAQFLFIHVWHKTSTTPTPPKETKRSSPLTPVKTPTLSLFRPSDKFHTRMTSHPHLTCKTSTPAQLMLLELSFSNEALKVKSSPGNLSSSFLFIGATGIFWKNMCVTLCSKSAGKFLFREQRYSSESFKHWPNLLSERAFRKCFTFQIGA